MKTISSNLVKFLLMSFLVLSVASVSQTFVPSAEAQSTTVTPDFADNAFVSVICNMLNLVTGNAGKAFAAFAIISVGIGFFTGKVSWGLMIGVAAGIAAIFGAPSIVAAISGDSSGFDCTDGAARDATS